MPYLNIKGREIELDEEGYLVNEDEWDEEVAQTMLKDLEGIEMDKETLEILRFMRSYYKKFNAFPILNAVCKKLHQPKECVHEKFLDPLLAWKAAGLPRPGTMYTESHDDEHKVYKLITAQ